MSTRNLRSSIHRSPSFFSRHGWVFALASCVIACGGMDPGVEETSDGSQGSGGTAGSPGPFGLPSGGGGFGTGAGSGVGAGTGVTGGATGSGSSSGSGGVVGSGGITGSGGSGAGGTGSGGGGCDGVGDIMTEAEFNSFFPDRNRAYSYRGMLDAVAGAGDLTGFPNFAQEGPCDTRKRELAAFLGNVARETGSLVFIEQINKSFPYCGARPYGCPAGTFQYFGRGPIQLSWNYNYYTASMALFGDDRLLRTPSLVATDPAIAWATALWFWSESTGAGSVTSHDAMVRGLGMGETIRTINGGEECGRGSEVFPSTAVSQRVCHYEKYVAAFGTSVGPGDLSCGTNVNRAAYCGSI